MSSWRNLQQYCGGFTGLAPDLLKRIDINSASGVSAGPGALGGTIRMTNVDAQDMLKRYGSWPGSFFAKGGICDVPVPV